MKLTATLLPRPPGSVVHIPDRWQQAGVRPSPLNRFEFEQLYTDGTQTLSESEMLLDGIACYRVQIDRFTARDFRAMTAK